MINKDPKIQKLMNELVKRNGSDLHITADSYPYFRIQGQILPANNELFTKTEFIEELNILIGEEKLEKLFTNKELDISYSHEDIARFRINYFLKEEKFHVL